MNPVRQHHAFASSSLVIGRRVDHAYLARPQARDDFTRARLCLRHSCAATNVVAPNQQYDDTSALRHGAVEPGQYACCRISGDALIADGILFALRMKHGLQLLRESLFGAYSIPLNHAGAQCNDLRMRRPNPDKLGYEKNSGAGSRPHPLWHITTHVSPAGSNSLRPKSTGVHRTAPELPPQLLPALGPSPKRLISQPCNP